MACGGCAERAARLRQALLALAEGRAVEAAGDVVTVVHSAAADARRITTAAVQSGLHAARARLSARG